MSNAINLLVTDKNNYRTRQNQLYHQHDQAVSSDPSFQEGNEIQNNRVACEKRKNDEK